MGLKKFGTGEITETENQPQAAKTAARNGWDETDEVELARENAQADEKEQG